MNNEPRNITSSEVNGADRNAFLFGFTSKQKSGMDVLQ
jgi:hypothetical protein